MTRKTASTLPVAKATRGSGSPSHATTHESVAAPTVRASSSQTWESFLGFCKSF